MFFFSWKTQGITFFNYMYNITWYLDYINPGFFLLTSVKNCNFIAWFLRPKKYLHPFLFLLEFQKIKILMWVAPLMYSTFPIIESVWNTPAQWPLKSLSSSQRNNTSLLIKTICLPVLDKPVILAVFVSVSYHKNSMIK